MNCRHCNAPVTHTFLNLGSAPLSNAYLTKADLTKPEIHYPLIVKVCNSCWLVQTEDYKKEDEIFTSQYAYFSSTSTTWLNHAERYSVQIIKQLGLSDSSFVIELASNDGYLLRNFLRAGISCLGVEPTASTAQAAEKLGIPVLREFFGERLGRRLAAEGKQADLVIGNNVYAHVPDINDFTRGLKAVLKPGGTITLEFPHLLRLMEQTQFDTVYHEHFSYLSLYSVKCIFSAAKLRVWNVEEIPTHGGSLRIYGCHENDLRGNRKIVSDILAWETKQGLQTIDTYINFQAHADKLKNDLLDFLIGQKRLGNRVIAYGAAAKGSTLLNYAGIKPDLIPFVCDAAISKQGLFMPGSHIPIIAPEYLLTENPDFILILPWNIASEIKSQLSSLGKYRRRYVRAIPSLQVME